MVITQLRGRILIVVGIAVTVPALVLAGLGIFLTQRIARGVEADGARYDSYIAQQVVEAFEIELLSDLRRMNQGAETSARAGGSLATIQTALEAHAKELGPAEFVPVDDLNGVSLILVESQLMVYGTDPSRRDGRVWYAGLMLRGPTGDVIGAGGWWFNPRGYLAGHLRNVVLDRLTANPRLYGGIESTRHLSVQVSDSTGRDFARIRDPGHALLARSAALTGPFEGYTVTVSPTGSAPVAWTSRFVAVLVTFICVMGMVIIFATIFGLRYTLRQVELANLKSSFVSNVSHELKTPIALIQLAVETLEMNRVTSPEQSQKFLETIGREALRLNALVDNILDFARLESGRHPFRFGPADVAEIARGAVETMRPRLDHQGFKVEMSFPPGLPLVRADATALSHCVLNLIDNAIKYSKARREIRISAAPREGFVGLSVSDHGIGIHPADQRRIFEKFVRVEAGLVHDVKGAGLGLALVDQIIRAHGGRIEVVSSPGEGSTFTLVLPRATEADLPALKPGGLTTPAAEVQERTGS